MSLQVDSGSLGAKKEVISKIEFLNHRSGGN
jgi:hypothetical protein